MKTTLAKLVASSAMAASFVATATVAAPAQAFQISIEPQYGSTEGTGASALLDFNFSQFAANQVKLDLNITNTTDGTKGLGATAATLVGIAFDGPDLPSNVFNLISYNPGTSNFTKLWLRGINTPSLSPYGDFDGAISLQRQQFEGGNPNGGLTAGNSTVVSFLFQSAISAIDISTGLENAFKAKDGSAIIAGRFQQVTGGGVVGQGSDKVLGGEPVPEPTSMAASFLALGGLGLFKKLKQKQAS